MSFFLCVSLKNCLKKSVQNNEFHGDMIITVLAWLILGSPLIVSAPLKLSR